MADSGWEYDTDTHRYRDLSTGRFLSQATMARLRDEFITDQKSQTADLAHQYANGDLTTNEWVQEMRTVVKDVHGGQYMFGRGGENAMQDTDWQVVDHRVRQQYDHLQDFATALNEGEWSESAIAARSALYVEAGSASFERGRIEARGMPDLDQYPGDGQTQCLTNCRCALAIDEVDGGWEVTWQAQDDPASCEDCIQLADAWNPLFVASGE